jgi:hypothetical protein
MSENGNVRTTITRDTAVRINAQNPKSSVSELDWLSSANEMNKQTFYCITLPVL